MRDALETLKTFRDNLAARKLLNVNREHLAALNDLVATLSTRTSEADRKETEKYAGLVEELATFQEAVAQFVSDSSIHDAMCSGITRLSKRCYWHEKDKVVASIVIGQ